MIFYDFRLRLVVATASRCHGSLAVRRTQPQLLAKHLAWENGNWLTIHATHDSLIHQTTGFRIFRVATHQPNTLGIELIYKVVRSSLT